MGTFNKWRLILQPNDSSPLQKYVPTDQHQFRGLFCSKPFKWFEVTGWDQTKRKGDVFLCCPSWLDVPIGSMESQAVEEIWNSPTAQKLRRSILDGSFEYCNADRCPFLQTVSGPVQAINEVSDPDLKRVISENLTVLPYGPREINCSYDKSCNLSCPTCRTEKIIEIEHEDEILAIQEKLKSQALHDAESIYVTGSGDAFGSPYFRQLIRTLNPDEMPRLKWIHLHTNGLLWTPENWKRIPERVRALIKTAEISIDAATPGTYAINRRGGNYEKLLKNLEFIASLRKAGPLESVTISMVVQENNFQEMVDFVWLGQRFGFDTVYFSQLVNWGTFTDEEYRRRAVHRRDHPRHSDFIEILNDDIFKELIVYLGNLTEILTKVDAPRGLPQGAIDG